jgi:hypothetical protein
MPWTAHYHGVVHLGKELYREKESEVACCRPVVRYSCYAHRVDGDRSGTTLPKLPAWWHRVTDDASAEVSSENIYFEFGG